MAAIEKWEPKERDKQIVTPPEFHALLAKACKFLGVTMREAIVMHMWPFVKEVGKAAIEAERQALGARLLELDASQRGIGIAAADPA